jgi:hypothetical protein
VNLNLQFWLMLVLARLVCTADSICMQALLRTTSRPTFPIALAFDTVCVSNRFINKMLLQACTCAELSRKSLPDPSQKLTSSPPTHQALVVILCFPETYRETSANRSAGCHSILPCFSIAHQPSSRLEYRTGTGGNSVASVQNLVGVQEQLDSCSYKLPRTATNSSRTRAATQLPRKEGKQRMGQQHEQLSTPRRQMHCQAQMTVALVALITLAPGLTYTEAVHTQGHCTRVTQRRSATANTTEYAHWSTAALANLTSWRSSILKRTMEVSAG